MTLSGAYVIAEAEMNAMQVTGDQTLMVKLDAANNAQDLLQGVMSFWKKQLTDLANEVKNPGDGNSAKFSEASFEANVDQTKAQSLSTQEVNVATNLPQQLANILHACSDIIGVLGFTAQLQASQS